MPQDPLMAEELGLIFETFNLRGFLKQTHVYGIESLSSQLAWRLHSFIHSVWVF